MLDRLTLDQLRVLIAVAESGSFSSAARRLGRVQSAISQSVQTLEAALGTSLFSREQKLPRLTEAGQVILQDARDLVRGAERLRSRAESIEAEVEPELTLAIDSMFPHQVLMPALEGLSQAFPLLPVTLFTEGLRGPEQRLRNGSARLAIYAPAPAGAADLDTEFLVSIPMLPVVATQHPLANEPPPIAREVIEQHVQLVLTDPAQRGSAGGIGILGRRIWRFDDPSTCYKYLRAGFGWRHMPLHMVEADLADGKVKPLALRHYGGRRFGPPLDLYLVHERGRAPGRAGRWLIEDLRRRLADTTGAAEMAGVPRSTVGRDRDNGRHGRRVARPRRRARQS
jgi:DNA-binding transcriptional LysR family regulator